MDSGTHGIRFIHKEMNEMKKELNESQRKFLQWVVENKSNHWFVNHTINKGFYNTGSSMQEHLNKVRTKYLQDYKNRK